MSENLKSRSLTLSLLMSVALICFGCENHLRFGPEESQKIVVVHTTTEAQRNIETALVIEKVTLAVWMEDKEGHIVEDKLALLNKQVVRPDAAIANALIAPRIVVDRVLRVLREDGKEDMLNVGGWYIRDPAPPRPSVEEKGE